MIEDRSAKTKKILAIGAHFDDIEIGAGGFLALEHDCGSIIKTIVVADGDYDSLEGQKIRTKSIAREEGMQALVHLGLDETKSECLGYPETQIPYDKEIICALEKIINDFNPDIILTHWPHDTHQDHINTAMSVISAARYRYSLLMWEPVFPSGRFSTIPFIPQLYVNVSAFIDSKIKSLKSHGSQVRKFTELNVKWIEGIVARAKFRGFECQSDYAETFFVYRMKYK